MSDTKILNASDVRRASIERAKAIEIENDAYERKSVVAGIADAMSNGMQQWSEPLCRVKQTNECDKLSPALEAELRSLGYKVSYSYRIDNLKCVAIEW